jgi:ATP-dependent DNA helicase RecG
MDIVEQLGTGVPRILQTYSKKCFYLSDNFIRMLFSKENVTKNITEQVEKLVFTIENEMTLQELMIKCGIKHRPTFIYNYIKPAMAVGFIEMSRPEKPNYKNQKYRLSLLRIAFKKQLA